MRIARTLAIASLFALPLAAAAQSISPSVIAAAGVTVPALTLTLSPTNPRPGGTLVVTPESTVLDLTRATVTISVNGTQVYSGNAQPVTVTAAGNGSATTIRAVATVAGVGHSASVTIHPGDVSLVAEPLSSAPPLYPGKALVPTGGDVRLVAVADLRTAPGKQLSPSTLSYVWKEGGATLESASGIGKSSIVLAAPLQYRSSAVSVIVSSADGSIVAEDSTTLSPQPPILRLYVDDPLLGILYDHTLGASQRITGSEITLVAVPYSFPTDAGLPQVNWFLNGTAAQTSPTITLRPTGQGAGSANVSASVSGANALINASAAITLLFGQSSSNFLGL